MSLLVCLWHGNRSKRPDLDQRFKSRYSPRAHFRRRCHGPGQACRPGLGKLAAADFMVGPRHHLGFGFCAAKSSGTLLLIKAEARFVDHKGEMDARIARRNTVTFSRLPERKADHQHAGSDGRPCLQSPSSQHQDQRPRAQRAPLLFRFRSRSTATSQQITSTRTWIAAQGQRWRG